MHVAGAVPQGGSPFPPIAAYAFLVEWMCVPRPDAPLILGAMLDRDAGSFKLAPVPTAVPASRRYLPGTLAHQPGRWQLAADEIHGLTHLALINAVIHVIGADAALIRGEPLVAVASATA